MPVTWLDSSLPEDADIPDTQRKMHCFAGQVWVWDDVQFEMLIRVLKVMMMQTLKIMT